MGSDNPDKVIERLRARLALEQQRAKFYMEQSSELAVIGSRMSAHIQMMRSMLGHDKTPTYDKLISDFKDVKSRKFTKPSGQS